MYLELAGTTAESFATYLAANPANTLPLLLEIKSLNISAEAAATTATVALNAAQSNINNTLLYFRYVHDAKGLGANALTFIATDGLQLIANAGTSSTLEIIPITVAAGSED